MIDVQILIPVASNEGETFTAAHHSAFEAFLIERFGGFSGFTRLPGHAEGGWADPTGRVYRDITVIYMVAVPALLGSADGLRAMADRAKAHYAQEAVLLRYLGIVEIL